MSKFDPTWPEEKSQQAAADGWTLAYTIDSGKAHAYYAAYPLGPKLKDPTRAMQHLVEQAHRGSKLHLFALQTIARSRLPAQARPKKGPKT